MSDAVERVDEMLARDVAGSIADASHAVSDAVCALVSEFRVQVVNARVVAAGCARELEAARRELVRRDERIHELEVELEAMKLAAWEDALGGTL